MMNSEYEKYRDGTFIELLLDRSAQLPDKPAYSFIDSHGQIEQLYSRMDLNIRVQTIAALLQQNGKFGDRVLLVYSPGIDFIAAFLGCILAGMIAPTSYGIKYKNNFDKIFPDLSKKYKLKFIPFLLKGVAMKAEFNLSDGMHPNDQGTIIIGNTLKKAILENL